MNNRSKIIITITLAFMFAILFFLICEKKPPEKKPSQISIPEPKKIKEPTKKTTVTPLKRKKVVKISPPKIIKKSTIQDDNDLACGRCKTKSFYNSGLTYGLSLSPIIIDQRDGTNSLTSNVTTAKFGFKTYIYENTFLYLRVKNVFLGILNKSGYEIDNYDNFFDLELAYLDFYNSDYSLNIAAGRKYFILGTGLTFNGRGDGLELKYFSKYLNLQLFGAYTGLLLKEDNPYELSSKDITDGAKRIFAGGSIAKEMYNQTIYLLGLSQIDLSSQKNSRYNSQYYGLGLKGLALDNLSYYAEFIYETGKSYLSGTENKKNINAFATTMGLNYYLNLFLNPVLIFQYAFGSGDKDRDNYNLSTGNTAGEDNGFITFGTFTAGYALRPLLSNIHIIRGGFSINPFLWSKKKYLNKMILTSKYTLYLKDKTEAPLNDGQQATLNKKLIGHAFDLEIKWKAFYDLAIFFNYGLFIPGDAYDSSEGNKQFFLLGTIINF